ncbi:major histocompatibility complex class I-related gene protein-like [Takifugu rubripes]|uniref:major histocompatibility complex class I-related gene protein-like n=1 Tax=Takifugu rubripes TaxID=31033 RepID=UPI001145CD94|nr:major histocompatibility complex class I-related gene protein-like [Takifugu rubripes]
MSLPDSSAGSSKRSPVCLLVQPSLTIYYSLSSGLPNIPEFFASVEVSGLEAGYCDTTKKKVEPKTNWAKTFLDHHQEQLDWYTAECVERFPAYMKYWMYNVKEIYNQTGGVHVIQKLDHCELDSETGEISAFSKFGYDGEDLLELDLKTLHWTALTPKALAVKPRWDSDEHRTLRISLYITKVFPERMKQYSAIMKEHLERTGRDTITFCKNSAGPGDRMMSLTACINMSNMQENVTLLSFTDPVSFFRCF